MRNSISKTMFASLAALTVGLATLGAVVPAGADIYSARNGQSPGAFSGTGAIAVSASPSQEGFTAFYSSANQPSHMCYDMTQLRQKMGSTGYSAIERC